LCGKKKHEKADFIPLPFLTTTLSFSLCLDLSMRIQVNQHKYKNILFVNEEYAGIDKFIKN